MSKASAVLSLYSYSDGTSWYWVLWVKRWEYEIKGLGTHRHKTDARRSATVAVSRLGIKIVEER